MNTPGTFSTLTPPQELNQRYLDRLINEYINGKICWQARLDYGQELCLEIGNQVPYDSPALQGEYKGEWQLGTRASDWGIVARGKIRDFLVQSSEDEVSIKKKIQRLNNQIISSIEIIKYSPGYCYRFNLGRYALLIPEQNSYDDLPLWELFMPDRRVLEVFPHRAFQLHSQDGMA